MSPEACALHYAVPWRHMALARSSLAWPLHPFYIPTPPLGNSLDSYKDFGENTSSGKDTLP